MSASPSPSPAPAAAAAPEVAQPAAAAAADASAPAAAPAAAAAPPAEQFIPSHTRAWTSDTRARYAKFCEQQELSAVTELLAAAPAPAPADGVRQPATPAPGPALSAQTLAAAADAAHASLTSPPPSGTLNARGRVIQVGDQAVVDFGRGKAWLNLDGTSTRTLRLGKQTAKVSNLAGQPYGCIWELDAKSQLLTRTDRKRGLGTALLDGAALPDPSRNNSRLHDTNASQALSQEQIEALKYGEGGAGPAASGAELVDLIVSNSATFASKTEFSQEKYVKKKRAKHCSEVSVLPISLARVAQAFWEKDPRKIRGMRPDTLAMLMSTGNVRAGASSLVVESCSGLILGGLLYRTQGSSYVIHAYEHNQKRTEGVKRFNFPADISSALLHVPLDRLLKKEVPVQGEGSVAAAAENAPAVAPSASAASAMDTSDAAAAPAAAASPAPASASASDSAAGDLTAAQVLGMQVDTLILATRYEPFALLQSLWPYLRPAGRFVVYDESLEPLAAAHARVSAGDMAINVVLSECFFREHQVLPNRTHPMVNMSASGGYLLSGIKMQTK